MTLLSEQNHQPTPPSTITTTQCHRCTLNHSYTSQPHFIGNEYFVNTCYTNCFSHAYNFSQINNHYSFKNSWIIDTGASDDIVHSLHLFFSYNSIKNKFIHMPNGSKSVVTHIGSVKLSASVTRANDILKQYKCTLS